MEIKYPNGPWEWHSGEKIAYTIDCSEWTESPTSPSVVEVIDESDGSDVVSTVMPSGSPSVTNAIIALPLFQLATSGRNYRVEVQFTGDNSSTLRCHGRVRAR